MSTKKRGHCIYSSLKITNFQNYLDGDKPQKIVTEQAKEDTYVAIMEPQNATVENQLFDNVRSTAVPKPIGFDNNGNNTQVSQLDGSAGNNSVPRVGHSIVLKVMAGDTVTIATQAWYQGAVQPPPSNATNLLNDLLNALTDGVISNSHGIYNGIDNNPNTILSGDLGQFFTNDENTNYSAYAPKAFLNWVAFDNQLNMVSGNSGVVQVPTITGSEQAQPLVAPEQIIQKDGYIYIYVSNESAQKVSFDNLVIHHNRGPILQTDNYYPFGLTMAGVSDQAALSLESNYKFNGIELNHKEFSDGTGLELYTAKFRGLDPQIGRWWQIDPKPTYDVSPYAAMGDEPILNNDFLGDTLITQEDKEIASQLTKDINNTNTALSNQATRLKNRISKANRKHNTDRVSSLTGKLNDINSRIVTNNNSLSHLNAIENDQTHGYTFNQLPAGSIEGGTKLGFVKNPAGKYQVAIVMGIVSEANAVHEITHAYQGGIEHSIILNINGAAFPGPNLFAQQMTDAISEIEAYRAQFAFDPTTMPNSTRGGTPQSMNNIDAFYVSGINDNSYPPESVYPNVQNMVYTIFQQFITF